MDANDKIERVRLIISNFSLDVMNIAVTLSEGVITEDEAMAVLEEERNETIQKLIGVMYG